MPIRIIQLDGGLGVEYRAEGVVTGAEIIEANRKLYSGRDFPRLRYKIIDRSGCTDYRVTGKEVRAIAELDRAASRINPSIVVALISATDLQYGISRMYQTYVDDFIHMSAVFTERAEAERWIEDQMARLAVQEQENGESR